MGMTHLSHLFVKEKCVRTFNFFYLSEEGMNGEGDDGIVHAVRVIQRERYVTMRLTLLYLFMHALHARVSLKSFGYEEGCHCIITSSWEIR